MDIIATLFTENTVSSAFNEMSVRGCVEDSVDRTSASAPLTCPWPSFQYKRKPRNLPRNGESATGNRLPFFFFTY